MYTMKLNRINKVFSTRHYITKIHTIHSILCAHIYRMYFSNFRPLTCFSVMIPEALQYNFDVLMMSICARNM